jgi:hypothetical protein
MSRRSVRSHNGPIDEQHRLDEVHGLDEHELGWDPIELFFTQAVKVLLLLGIVA